ncbi:MAG: ribonuclease III domain-containing protein [Clostridiales bacterium]|nr:ribonuclease III domain-containing protein [Clostridiales bacterium]
METGVKETEDVLEEILGAFELEEGRADQYSPLTLAFIGDCIYDLVIRTMIVEKGNAPVNVLHHRAASLVKASAQTKLYYQIEPFLTEKEQAIFRRGRNAKSYTMAKNASMSDYRTATGVEALVGYLYLDHQMERVIMLIKKGLETNHEK